MNGIEYDRNSKVERILGIYTKLMNGHLINKAEEALHYGVNERSIQRDIDDIRDYLEVNTASQGYPTSVIYDRVRKGYRLEQTYTMKLSNSEILAICKILLDSRAFTKKRNGLHAGTPDRRLCAERKPEACGRADSQRSLSLH